MGRGGLTGLRKKNHAPRYSFLINHESCNGFDHFVFPEFVVSCMAFFMDKELKGLFSVR